MNVNYDKGLFWLIPEFTGGDFIFPFLERNGFVFELDHQEKNQKKYKKYVYSNKIGNIEGFASILSLKNPYYRMFHHFQKYSNTLIRASMLEPSIKLFEKWINIHFYKSYTKVTLIADESTELFKNSFNMGSWKNKVPNYIVRVENLNEDLSKIPDFEFEFSEYEEFEGRTDIDYRKFYTFELAQKVFWYYRDIFFLGDYDPFSFTEEKFSDTEKQRFIHEI